MAAVPPVREASRAAWAADPYLQAFFATADDIPLAFSRAPDLRAYFEQNPGLPEAFAVLGMEMAERKVLGMALEGEIVRRDVEQTTVRFGDYRVRICGRSEDDLKAEIERRLVDQLALEGLARIVADQSRRKELEQARALLKSRLQMLERKGAGMRGALGGEAVGTGRTRASAVQIRGELHATSATSAAARKCSTLNLITFARCSPSPRSISMYRIDGFALTG